MIKFIFWFWVIGFVCAILAHIMIMLKVYGVCKRKNIPLHQKTKAEGVFGYMRIIFTSAIPIYNYLLFLCVIFCSIKKFEKIAIEKAKEQNDSIGEQK